MEIAVTGAEGRMGRKVREEIEKSEHGLAFAVDVEPEEPEVEDVDRLRELLQEEDPDALIDFTAPSATVEFARTCSEAGVPFVTGTTGLDDEQASVLEGAAESVPVLKASNFAPGIQALRNAVREAVSSVPGYDVEVTETHHNGKTDAPSGTALEIVRDIEEEIETSGRTHGREGEQPREEGEIGVHARRAGDVRGEHEVLLAGNHEVLTLRHRSESRNVFAAGAVEAAEWLQDRGTGFYTFDEVFEQ
ncbi:MAG: 4-hydroxy-tetrahydrodipicolinate reductase [Candidatus Nanohaloarchaea archaeon]